MSDDDLALLGRMLGFSPQRRAAAHPDYESLGFVRLDECSGLFLQRGPDDGHWFLQARTWTNPAPASVHEWHVAAVDAAHQLDPTVTPPDRLPAELTATTQRWVGRAQNHRLSGLRRRLTGIG